MECISVTELSEVELMAYLEGEAPQDVVAHLERCPYCFDRLNVLAGEQALVKARLFRSKCPSTIELGEYHLDKVPPQERMAIARHLRECTFCRAEVRQLEDYLKDLALAADTLDVPSANPLRVLVARLLSGGASDRAPQPAMAPIWAGVRGSEAGSRVYQADDFQITLEAQQDPHNPARKILIGLIIGPELLEMEAHLWQQGRPVTSVEVEDTGNFILPGVETGLYELTIQGRGLMIQIQDLEVK